MMHGPIYIRFNCIFLGIVYLFECVGTVYLCVCVCDFMVVIANPKISFTVI